MLPRVRAKLAAEPVEDLRVDAEDGYRGAADAEDDDVRARRGDRGGRPGGRQRAAVLGIRAKSLEEPTRRRGVRSLDLFLGALRGLPRGSPAGPW